MDTESKLSPNGTCEICCDPYDKVERIPKFLSCFHTFCARCLQKLETNFAIQCPLCRKDTVVGEEGSKELQTNFYILQDMEQHPESVIAKAVETDLKFCTICKRTASSICSSVNHNIIDLAQDRLSGSMHLQILMLTCKTNLTAALNKRREVQVDLDAAQKAIHEFGQQLTTIRKENKAIINELLDSINETDLTDSPKTDSGQLLQLLEKFGTSCERADHKMKTASILSAACQSIRNSLVSVDLKADDGSTSNLLQSKPLAGSPENNDDSVAAHLGVLSYLALSIRYQTEFEPLRVPSAESNDTAQVVKTPKKAAKPAQQPKSVKEVKRETENDLVKNQKPANDRKEAKKVPKTNASENHRISRVPTGPPAVTAPVNKANVNKAPAAPDTGRAVAPIQPAFTSIPPHLMKRKCFLTLSVNGKFYGKVVFHLRPDVAPIMCAKFVQSCTNRQGSSYVGTVLYGAKPMEKILGGRLPGNKELYMADRSPLKRTRGSIMMRLKKDLTKTHCFIVSTEFFIFLSDQTDSNRESTVFGSISDGLAVCDAISHLDFTKNHVAITDAGAFQ